jgi:dTDP-4-dehydrorhamnose reductase
MIIGNGFIASAFKNANLDNNNLLIFASGVSNSLSSDSDSGFAREKKLIESYSNTKKTFIYFSTSSIFDKSRESSPYIRFKLMIEKFIQNNFDNYVIYRLPIIAGKSNNPHTLLNYIFNSIKESSEIKVELFASRYIVDIDDVVSIVNLTAPALKQQKFNLNFDNKIKITDLISIFEDVLGKKAIIKKVRRGSSYNVNNNQLKIYMSQNSINSNRSSDIKKMIQKYYL